MTAAEVVFATFGLTSQSLLVLFFGARRWLPPRADLIGRAAYGFAGLGLPVGLALLSTGESWRLFVGPLLMAAWALLGAVVDIWRPRRWRGPPILWDVLIPYLGLYFFAQMFMWWPLWNIARGAWIVFCVLFVVNTVLNMRGHFEPGPRG
jgi:hypothetical protein